MKNILPQVEKFLKKSGMRPSTLGRHICNDAHFVTRLRKGGKVFPWTAEKARSVMKNYNPKNQNENRA